MGKFDKSDQSRKEKLHSVIRKNQKKMSKSLKNGLTRAILGKCDESDQSWTGKKYF